jgi:3-methyladenine DNA glycosylase AlkD
METYLATLRSAFEQQAKPEVAVPMAKYMRNQFAFLGIKSPEQKALLRQFLQAQGQPELAHLDAIVRTLWTWPQREFQYVALALLDQQQQRLTPEWIPLLEELITTKSWWDTVDSIASHNVGKLLWQFPDSRDRTLIPWRQTNNIWLRRTTLLFQLGYKTETDADLLFALIRENLVADEFFIQKAIGWALREYSKVAPEPVKAFVAAHPLAPLSRREALKWLQAKEKL